MIGRRYAVEALKLAKTVESPEQEAELLRIAEVCKRVPAKPARTFHEALQSLWFAHILNTWEDYINANSLGRLDQILYPYYREDIASGRITREEAFELICCLWIKLYRDYDVQQSCIGGTFSNGASAVNELSYMMLDATEALGFIRCLSVRFSHNTERKFLRRALEVVSRVGKGVPFFFNDDVMIPALAAKGIAYEDACDYTQIGCVETVIPGKANPHAVTGVVNLLKAVEYALADGASMIHPEYEPGIPTGDPLSWAGYKEFHDAVFAQIEHILDTTCSRIVKETIAARTNCPKPVKSLLTSGCVESGRDFNNHGALYDYYQVTIGGIPNLADAMAAVKKLVYGEKRYAMAELINALRKDFPDEAMRLDFVNKAPKYGNDIDEVDGIAAEIMDYACGKLEALSKKYGYSFHAQPFTFFWMVDQGRMTAATPDGRHAGEITAYSVSPMQGRDFCGLTALFNSITKLPSHKAPGTTSAIIEVDPKLFKDIDKLTDILFTAAEKGLCNVQFNTIDAETLRDAQRNPDRHRNLAVRVSGFSQKFHLLNKPLQDHIIARTKHLRV
jgi:formate C-acetyltransferase